MAATPKPERKVNKEIKKNVGKFYEKRGESRPKQIINKEAKTLEKSRKSMMQKFEHRHSKSDLSNAHQHMKKHGG